MGCRERERGLDISYMHGNLLHTFLSSPVNGSSKEPVLPTGEPLIDQQAKLTGLRTLFKNDKVQAAAFR